MSATEINMSVDECFDILDGLLGTDGYIAITEAVKKLVKQNNEFKESDKHLNKCIDNIRDQYLEQKEQNKEWKDAANDHAFIDNPDELESWMSAAIHEDDELYSKYMEPLKLRDEIKTLKQTVSNYYDTQRELMSESCVPNDTAFETKVIEIRNEIKTLKEENEELKERAEDTFQQIADALCGEGDEADDMAGWGQEAKLIRKAKELKDQVKMFVSQIYNPKHEDELVVKKLNDEIKLLKKKVAELDEPVFQADMRCYQFRVKVGYSFIHDILTEVHDMDLDGPDDDDDSGTLKCVEEFKESLFNECAGAVNRVINEIINNGSVSPIINNDRSNEIGQHIIEEIGNVVELFQRDGYITED